ncbi:MAG TPA: hypothetical protein VGC54_05665, partial [Planctomycetota bacterium]
MTTSVPVLRIACLLLPAALLSALARPPAARASRLEPLRSPTAASLALAARLGPATGSAPRAFVRARTVAERLRTGVPAAELPGLQRGLDADAAALAVAGEAADLPWRDWITTAQ